MEKIVELISMLLQLIGRLSGDKPQGGGKTNSEKVLTDVDEGKRLDRERHFDASNSTVDERMHSRGWLRRDKE